MRSSALFLLTFLIGVATGCSYLSESQPTDKRDKQADDSVNAALRESRADDALRIAQNALVEAPNDPDALTDAARATAAVGDRHEASNLLAEAARAADFKPVSRVELSVRAFLDLGRVYPAIDLLTDAIDKQPNSHQLRRTLYGILGEAGRTDLMQEHFEAIIRSRQFDVPVLIAFTDTSRRLFVSDSMDVMIQRNPADHRLKLGIAQSLRDNQRFVEAESVLREILTHHPDFAPAHALLGRMPTIQQATDADFADWYSAAAPLCAKQAGFWIAMGDRHYQSNDFAAAIACYRSAAQISPNLPTAWIQISRLLQKHDSRSGENQQIDDHVANRITEACDAWAQGLFRVRQNLERFGGRNESSQRAAADVARALNEMGRYWEAEAWAAIATTLPDESDPTIGELRNEIIVSLKQNQQWSSPPDLSALDVFALKDASRIVERPRLPSDTSAISGSNSELRLVDETIRRGLIVRTVDYPDIASSLIYSLGAGGGALDFDLDGRSDLVFRSGGQIREGLSDTNSFLRNIDGQFETVAIHAGCDETGNGQGIAIGDYNEDGFPDIFFANIGPNRLLRNNGDGTFSDDTQALGDERNQWTTCGAFADFNHDGIVDLLAVNYCDLDSDVGQPCRNANGIVPCHPARFPADNDQVLIGDSYGSFKDSYQDVIQQISPGRGLGIVAGSLMSSDVSALVANDMSTNHLLQVDRNGLTETAVLSGLAVDGQSRTQASMGIAHGDFDGDLDLDFYVTGFAREYNIYYEQVSQGLWIDATHRQRLVEPTRLNVGFGAQAIDLDADGIDELAITNGHIGDFGPDQPPLAQAFQLMKRSQKTGRFQQADLSTSDPYFREKHIGRALFKVDVDRDLADDLVITHQNSPPVLLVNRTKTANRNIGLKLVGTASSRDAVGATVKFVADGRLRAVWLMSGDGYMCSNERILRAGVGASEQIEEVTVTWPGGTVESFDSLNSGQIHLLVEGSGESFEAH